MLPNTSRHVFYAAVPKTVRHQRWYGCLQRNQDPTQAKSIPACWVPSSKEGNQTRSWVDDVIFLEGLNTWKPLASWLPPSRQKGDLNTSMKSRKSLGGLTQLGMAAGGGCNGAVAVVTLTPHTRQGVCWSQFLLTVPEYPAGKTVLVFDWHPSNSHSVQCPVRVPIPSWIWDVLLSLLHEL